jgi:hypothetical protein
VAIRFRPYRQRRHRGVPAKFCRSHFPNPVTIVSSKNNVRIVPKNLRFAKEFKKQTHCLRTPTITGYQSMTSLNPHPRTFWTSLPIFRNSVATETSSCLLIGLPFQLVCLDCIMPRDNIMSPFGLNATYKSPSPFPADYAPARPLIRGNAQLDPSGERF